MKKCGMKRKKSSFKKNFLKNYRNDGDDDEDELDESFKVHYFKMENTQLYFFVKKIFILIHCF